MPPELMRECTSLEYKLARHTQVFPPVFLFVIDTGASLFASVYFWSLVSLLNFFLYTAIKHPDEMEAMKASILRSLELIPQNAYVGLITYAQNVRRKGLLHPFAALRFIS